MLHSLIVLAAPLVGASAFPPSVVAYHEETAEPAPDPAVDVAIIDEQLAEIRAAIRLGEAVGARELLEELVEPGLERLLRGCSEADALPRYGEIGAIAVGLGLPRVALEAETAVHDRLASSRDPDDKELLAIKSRLAEINYALREFEDALELSEYVHEARERLLPEDHFDRLTAQQGLAAVRVELGDYEGALALFEQILASWERRRPVDELIVLRAKGNLGGVRLALRDFEGAHELFESAHAGFERLALADDTDLLMAKQNLALSRKNTGDLEGALELEEFVYSAWEAIVPSDDPRLLLIKLNLGATRRELGDYEGALELEESVHAAWNGVLASDHVHLLRAKEGLALTRQALGDHDSALRLQRQVKAARDRLYASDHPDRLLADTNLAVTLRRMGDLEGALSLQESVHSVLEQRRPAGHFDLLLAKQNLAVTRRELRDFEGALGLDRDVYAERARRLPSGHRDLLRANVNLAVACLSVGDLQSALEMPSSLADGITERVIYGLAGGPREARAIARDAVRLLAEGRVWRRASDAPQTDVASFMRALETARHVATARFEVLDDGENANEELDRLRRAVEEARRALDDHFNLAPAPPVDSGDKAEEEWRSASDAWSRTLARLSLDRDMREKELREALGESRSFFTVIEPEALSAALGEGEVAVGIHKLDVWTWDGDSATYMFMGRNYVAYVALPSGRVREVDLGDAREIELSIRDWRRSLGTPLMSRGFGSSNGGGAEADRSARMDESAAGSRVREMIFDPIARASELARGGRVFLCLDDALHTVPLDALPIDEAEGHPRTATKQGDTVRLGDLYDIRPEISFARLLAHLPEPEERASMLVVGGLSYDEDPDGPGSDHRVLPSGVLERAAMSRGDGSWGHWAPLPSTVDEARAITELGRVRLNGSPELLSGSTVTESTLRAAVPGKRYVHIATHGWFMPDTIRSMLDPEGAVRASDLLGTERTVAGFLPEALCGLVLSGANAADTPAGLSERLLTALELSSFDLRECELAVLSACETNVGVARSGQGIQSLLTGLHQAGARAAVTSLWKVPDGDTARLMERFYENLWKEGMGKAEALWAAKCHLRVGGAAPADWAGWVLVGDPD
ncbi:MAG: CHAT domain-containing tetratricopeptide repeat protein [Planctomycetota bacterium]